MHWYISMNPFFTLPVHKDVSASPDLNLNPCPGKKIEHYQNLSKTKLKYYIACFMFNNKMNN